MYFAYVLSAALLVPTPTLFAVALSTNTNNQNTPNPLKTKIKNAPLALSEELGCSPTLTALMEPFQNNNKNDDKKNKKQVMVYFDPLQLATDENFGRYREAELKHGRVCMLVVVTCLFQTFAQQQQQQDDPIGYFTSGHTPHVLELLKDWSAGGDYAFFSWIHLIPLAQMLIVCGILETLLLVQASPQDMPGDYGLGYFGVRDKGQNEASLVSELENGRLAMMVILYWVVVELLPPSVTSVFQELMSSSSQYSPLDAFLTALGGANLMGEIMANGDNNMMGEVVTAATTTVTDHII